MLPIASDVQSWSPSLGRVYEAPTTTGPTAATTKPREATPMPDTNKTPAILDQPHSRFLEEALNINLQFGDHHMDENPITGRPGEFHLSSTGRKGTAVNLSATAAANLKKVTVLPALNTKVGVSSENPLAAKGPTGKETKSPKTPSSGAGLGGVGGMQKAKKRKSSKAAVTPS